MLNPDVFCRDVTIFVKMFVPYNGFKGSSFKKHSGLEIFLYPYVPVGKFSKFHSPGRIVPNFLKI
jgi:hypothetical protein